MLTSIIRLLIMLSTTNSDLWKRVQAAVSSKNLELPLVWAQGHLDTVAPKQNFPLLHVALNVAADHFADIAAHGVQLPMHVVSGVLYHTKLVKRIEFRLVRVLISHTQKIKYERRFPKLAVEKPSLDSFVLSSSHTLVLFANGWKCVACSGSMSRNAITCREWLSSICSPRGWSDAGVGIKMLRGLSLLSAK